MSLFLAELGTMPQILTVGDVMLDRYIVGEVRRISPEAPVPVLAALRDDTRAGGAANVAANVAALGGKSHLLGIAGNDGARMDLEKLLADLGVECEFVIAADQRTTEKIRLVAGVQQLARIDRDGLTGHVSVEQLHRRFESSALLADVILFSDYNKGTLQRLPELLAKTRQMGKIALVDPKGSDPEHYRGAFLLKPNAAEFRTLFGPCGDGDLAARAREVLHQFDIEHIVITRGAKGMLLVSADGEAVERPTDAIEVFDVSGAGDTVLATLAVSLGCHLPIQRAMELSNVAAGIAVAHAGTYVLKAQDMDRRLAAAQHVGSKIVTSDVLCRLLDGHRKQRARIVFTNGCFDILHTGHVRMLKAARAEGDILVLGLNSDESVRRLKGVSRPINGFEDRAEVLAGLACVDYIAKFAEDTPIELIRTLQPDVLVKGGDYKKEDIVGNEIVIARGGRVISSPFYGDHSTSNLVRRMAQVK